MEEIGLRVFAITKTGLIAIALAVASLWTCIGMEAVTRRRADRTLWKLRQNSVPAAAPSRPVRDHPVAPAVEAAGVLLYQFTPRNSIV